MYRSDTANGVYDIVPNQSAIMSPMNRTNPDYTDGDGHFGWDVIAGFYKVRAEKPDCFQPSNPGQAYAETEALEIPPPVFDLDIRLQCPTSALPARQGDIDCNEVIEGFDALQVLYFSAGFTVTQLGECPQLGLATAGVQSDVVVVRGDVDCDGDIDAGDAVAILRGTAGTPLTDLPDGLSRRRAVAEG